MHVCVYRWVIEFCRWVPYSQHMKEIVKTGAIIKEGKVALVFEVAQWRLLVGPFPDGHGKSCLAPETLLIFMLGDAHPVGPSNNAEPKAPGKSVPVAGCVTAEEKYHMDACSHQATSGSTCQAIIFMSIGWWHWPFSVLHLMT